MEDEDGEGEEDNATSEGVNLIVNNGQNNQPQTND